MTNLLKLKTVAVISTALLLGACATSNDVVSGNVFSKRKHTRGYHVNLASNKKAAGKAENEKTVAYAPATEKVVNDEVITNSDAVTATDAAPAEVAAIETTVTESAAAAEETTTAAPGAKHTQKHVTVTKAEKKELIKAAKEYKKAVKKSNKKQGGNDTEVILLYILCFIIPPVAVGLATDWETKPVLINILLTLLCGIPGVIHAIIIVSRNS
jgi:uncharacterized membrane protein YqaE (UPF0057 family)